MVDRPPITWIGAHPSNYSTGRQGYALECIVLHVMAGTLAGTDSWFNNPQARASTHFGIGKDGAIHQYVALADMPYANGAVESGYTSKLVAANAGINPNLWTVSIEHEGYDLSKDITAAMWSASTRLSAWLFQDALFPSGATGVAVDRDHIIGHWEISPRSRPNCPSLTETQYAGYITEVKRLLSATPQPVPPPAVDYKALYEQEHANYIRLRDATTATVRGLRDDIARLTIHTDNLEREIR